MTFWDRLYWQSQQSVIGQQSLVPQQYHCNLSKSAFEAAHTQVESVVQWLPSPAQGVVRLLLERDGGEQTTRASSLVAYQSGSRFASHAHPLGEEFLVLSGTFSDEYGDYPAGTYVRNPPNSSHRPFSRDGCLIFVKLQQFDPEDGVRIVEPEVMSVVSGERVLFDAYERVSILVVDKNISLRDWCESNVCLPFAECGVEILVVEGGVMCGQHHYSTGAWLRLPNLSVAEVGLQAGTKLWLKMGHLSKPLLSGW